MRLVGIDLAWQGDRNPSAIAVGSLNNKTLHIESVEPAVKGLESLQGYLMSLNDVTGIAIDAPLVINNESGQRECEKELSKEYGSRKASCHTSNLSLYPNALSVSLSNYLQSKGYEHLTGSHWQFECYPHPALIECFDLPERLLYKKGKVSDKKCGQIELAKYLKILSNSDVVKLTLDDGLRVYLSEEHINSLKGNALKSNEDVLDAIMCVYIAALYALKVPSTLYGTETKGYIWVPRVKCI